MKFTLKWLKKFVDFNATDKQTADKITAAGLEVESIENEVFTISVPPNRADCLGMVGLTRDIAAVANEKYLVPKITKVTNVIDDTMPISVEEPKDCPKYLSRVIRGVDNTRQTPSWIEECLNAAGQHSISPIVDITNYVLLEWGQPTHAFDIEKINEKIVVRKAKQGESLTLLDESEVTLDSDTLVVADAKHALAVAGVKGGMDSGIQPTTKDIVLECAYFEPVGIRLASRKTGIKTDSAYRFERCIDPHMQEEVMEHLTQLVLDVVGGKPGPVEACVFPEYLPEVVTINLRLNRINKILGLTLSMQKVDTILKQLGCETVSIDESQAFKVTIPSFRQDIHREIDLVEEVGRVYGLDEIPATPSVGKLSFVNNPEHIISESEIISCLVNRGYHEAITYSFIESEYAKKFSLQFNSDLVLTNPISIEMNYMRPSLLPGLVDVIRYNQKRQQDRIKVFEIGLRFSGDMKNLKQIKTVAGASYGCNLPEGWANEKRLVDIFDVKCDVFALFKMAKNLPELTFKVANDKCLHPGQSLDVYLNDKLAGKIGVLHPQLQKEFELTKPVVMFELDYDMITNGKLSKFENFSKFPAVRRDLAVLVPRTLCAGNMEHAIRKEAGELLKELTLFDVYQGKGIGSEQKSMALGLILQHIERTLTDQEVNEVVDNVINMLKNDFHAELR